VINSGTGCSYASELFIPRILRGHLSYGYPMAHAYKNLVSGAELGANQGVPTPVLAAATATYQTALLRGHGEEDKGAMGRGFEELLGVAFRESTCSLMRPKSGGALQTSSPAGADARLQGALPGKPSRTRRRAAASTFYPHCPELSAPARIFVVRRLRPPSLRTPSHA
jgi:hypothetical protein